MPINHLPKRAQPAAHRLRAFLLTDGALLIILGLECIIRGVGYITHTPPGHPAERFFSLSIWAGIWLAIGVACIVTSPWNETLPAAVSLALGVGVNGLWAGSLLTASMTNHGGPDTSFGGAGSYAAVAIGSLWVVWRTSRAAAIRKEVAGA